MDGQMDGSVGRWAVGREMLDGQMNGNGWADR